MSRWNALLVIAKDLKRPEHQRKMIIIKLGHKRTHTTAGGGGGGGGGRGALTLIVPYRKRPRSSKGGTFFRLLKG